MTLIFDNTFEGLLTVIFDSYALKIIPDRVIRAQYYIPEIFDDHLKVGSCKIKATRVVKGLKKRLSAQAINNLTKVFYSELPDADLTIFQYARLTLSSDINIENDFRKQPVLRVKEIVKMMRREIHRMHAFVRFQKTVDDIYAATVVPDFDVMPFIGEHFKKRYADQHWMIYDTKRDYGLFYDQHTMEFIHLNSPEWSGNKKIGQRILSEDELSFQQMWAKYFMAASIKERRNLRLHLQHVPRRYWQYLPEKYIN